MKVTYVKSEKIAKDIYSFYFKPEKPVRYTAGQFIELYIPHPSQDKRGKKRWFTLSSAPHEELLAITTRFTDPNGSSFKQALQGLNKDTILHMASPMGDFVLPKDSSIPLVFVAGGIGCTPFRSIIRDLQLTNEARDIQMIYASRNSDSVAFLNIFQKLGDQFKIILSDIDTSWKGETGKLNADKVYEMAEIKDNHYVYLSGPEPLVETLNDELKAKGLNKRHIYTDFFPNYLAE
jgi:glycine betaine catabolism B